MKQSVKQMLQMLPEYCLVGLISFGAMVTGMCNCGGVHKCSLLLSQPTQLSSIQSGLLICDDKDPAVCLTSSQCMQ